MIKKSLLTLIFLILIGLLLFTQTRRKDQEKAVRETHQNSYQDSLLPKSAKQAPVLAIKKLAKSLPAEISNSDSWEYLQDFTLEKDQFYKKIKNKNQFHRYSKELIEETLKCLEANFCGATPDEDTGYFDPKETPAQKTIKRVLDLTIDEGDLYPQDMLLQLMDNQNDKISELALLHLMNKKTIPYQSIMSKISEQKGDARARNLRILLKQKNLKERPLLMEEILRGLKELPPYSTISLLENCQGLSFSGEELKEMAIEVCPHKAKKGNEHNWKAISYLLGNMMKKRNLKLSDFCQ